ncbi:MAG: hypothetical protein F6K04_23850 [Leptolyngbya sp. SIO4C5]|nr:hypothetical protein [Leptolyngbya sp. SIO4C5]
MLAPYPSDNHDEECERDAHDHHMIGSSLSSSTVRRAMPALPATLQSPPPQVPLTYRKAGIAHPTGYASTSVSSNSGKYSP